MSSTRVIFNNGLIFVPALNCFAYAPQLAGKLHDNFIVFSGTELITDALKTSVINQLLMFRQHSVNTINYQTASVILNTACAGECEYCYAGDTRFERKKLSKATLQAELPADVKTVTVYGGEPLLDVDYFRATVLETVKADCAVYAVTGLLYNEGTFSKLFALMDSHPNLHLSLSLDPKPLFGDYTRRYMGASAYEMLVRRVGQLIDAYPTRTGISCTITNNCYDILSLITDLRKYTAHRLVFNACPVDAGVSEKALDCFIAQLQHLPPNVVVNDGRGVYDPITNELGFLRLFGKCKYLCGTKPSLCINVDGNHCGCNQTITGKHDHAAVRANTWDKCKLCDFFGVCGGYCYLKHPEDSSCKWSIYSAMSRIWNAFKDLSVKELQAAIAAANSHVRVEPNNPQ